MDFFCFITSFKKMTIMTRIKKANGKDVIISNFDTVPNTSISGFTLPSSTNAMVANNIKTDHITRCFLFGFLEPLSVNILNTNTAESTEVTRKLMSNKMVVKFRTVANGYC